MFATPQNAFIHSVCERLSFLFVCFVLGGWDAVFVVFWVLSKNCQESLMRLSRPCHANAQIGMTLLSACCSVTVVAVLSFIHWFGRFSRLSEFFVILSVFGSKSISLLLACIHRLVSTEFWTRACWYCQPLLNWRECKITLVIDLAC